jgi:hypothetical protein
MNSDPLNQEDAQPSGEKDLPPWVRRSGLDITQATELLDWLEANGFHHRELIFHPHEGFTVRWRAASPEPPGEAPPR